MKYSNDFIYNGPWHAFYSAKSIQNKYDLKTDKKEKIYTNFYKKKDSNQLVETTSVFRTDKYPNFQDCPYYFDDKVYLGIVDKWKKKGQYTKTI